MQKSVSPCLINNSEILAAVWAQCFYKKWENNWLNSCFVEPKENSTMILSYTCNSVPKGIVLIHWPVDTLYVCLMVEVIAVSLVGLCVVWTGLLTEWMWVFLCFIITSPTEGQCRCKSCQNEHDATSKYLFQVHSSWSSSVQHIM